MKKSMTSHKHIVYLFSALCGVMVFLLTLSVNALYVSAESPSFDLPLTIGIPESLSDLGLDSNIVDSVRSNYFSILAGYGNDVSSNYTIFVETIDSNNVIYITATNLLEVTNSSAISTDYLLTYRNLGQHFVQFTYDSNSGVLSSGNFYGGWVAEWRPFTKLTMAVGKGWILDSAVEFPNYWVFPSEVPDNTGHATPPINDNGHYIPNPHPNKPSPNPYVPSVPQFPSVDTSTLESLVESLIDVVEYGFNFTGSLISGWFNNLLSNVTDYLDYIGDLLVYGFNNVVGAIQDFATDFYNNMVSVFEPIYEFFSGVSDFFNSLIQLGMVNGSFDFGEFIHNLIVPSTSDVLDLLIDNDSVGSHSLYLALYHKVSDLINAFLNLQPIKVFNVPSTTWHGYTIGGFTIDFSWYDDYKIYMDLILSGFLVISYLYWLYLQLNSLFRGTGSVVYDSLYESSTKGGDSH